MNAGMLLGSRPFVAAAAPTNLGILPESLLDGLGGMLALNRLGIYYYESLGNVVASYMW